MVERIEDTCIRIRSEMNEWMDCIFIVSEEDAVRAEKVLQEAWDSYWEDGDGWCYGNYLEDKMIKAGIAFDAYYSDAEGGENMAEYKEISSGLKMLLSKAEEMGWNWDAYIEPDNRRAYVEIRQASPAGEDFSMIIDFKEKEQAKSFKENLQMYYEDFDVDEHIEMWIEARRNGISGVPSTRELVKDAEAIENMILELCEALSQVRLPLLIGSYSPENGSKPEIIDRDYYRQGWIFKDEDAFQNRPDDVCYIPELSDEKYTRNDILKILAGDEELAETMFEELDWQHPESLLEDWKANGEVAWCPHCIGYVQVYDEEIEKCPVCGAELED